MLNINRKFFHKLLEITTTKSVNLIAKITKKNREILEGLLYGLGVRLWVRRISLLVSSLLSVECLLGTN